MASAPTCQTCGAPAVVTPCLWLTYCEACWERLTAAGAPPTRLPMRSVAPEAVYDGAEQLEPGDGTGVGE